MSEQPSRSLPMPKAKRGMKSFFEGVKREMKKVSWPTPQETHRLFGVVVTVCFILVLVMSILGYAFETLVNMITKTGGK